MSDTNLTRQVETDPVLRLFLDSLTDQAVFSVDPEGRIATWNEGCVRLKGYTAEEAIGENFRMLYTPEDQESGRPEDNLRRAREEGVCHEVRERVLKGGGRFMAEVSIYPIESEGGFVGYAKIVKDVTERVRCEQELERSNREWEGFCHSIAHDLRTPIRAIVSNCRIVQEEFAADLPVEALGNLDALVRSGLRLSQLVDDLLEFARLGQGELKRQDVDASALASRLADELGPRCQAGTGSIEVQEGVRADADPTMLEFVLRNLFENACKYSGPGVRVSFGMDMVGGTPAYRVRDDGIGFDVRYVDRLFEPFQRLHRDDAYGGTGIGLANVKRIVDRHGGRVWAESEPGKGSTFWFTLR